MKSEKLVHLFSIGLILSVAILGFNLYVSADSGQQPVTMNGVTIENFNVTVQGDSATGESFGGIFHNRQEYFQRGAVFGGDLVTVTSGTSGTTTAQELCYASYISFTPTASTSLLYLPTATSLDSECLNANGGRLFPIFVENTATGDAHMVITAQTGDDLLEVDGGAITIEEGEWGLIWVMRKAAGTTEVMGNIWQDAD